MGEQAKVSADVGARLREAGASREARLRRRITERVEARAADMAEHFGVREADRGAFISALLGLVLAEAVQTARDADVLREAGPACAVLLDDDGGRTIIARPAAEGALDVDAVLRAGRAAVREGEAVNVRLPRLLVVALGDLAAAIGGAP